MRDVRPSGIPEPGPKGCAVYLLLLCIAGGITTAYWGGFRGAMLAVALFVLAGSIAWIRNATRPRMRMSLNPHMIAWIHPERGAGAVAWKDVGALMIQPGKGPEGTSVCLIPREKLAGEAFIITVRDLGGKRDEGEALLRDFVGRMMSRLPADLTVDRSSRKVLESWGIRWGG
jgi:hypothetical protein